MTTLSLSMDSNGNKILRIKEKGKQGFSIQTLGNLPMTHKIPLEPNLIDEIAWRLVGYLELKRFVEQFGTKHQKSFFDFEEEQL